MLKSFLEGVIKMNIGDTIQCNNAEDVINTMLELSKSGIETDLLYEKDGVKGLWLEIISVEQQR